MLTVVTPATTTQLTTVAAVRAETGVTTGEMDDATVGALIDMASGLVAEHCNRVFAMETIKETIVGPRVDTIILSRMPVASIGAATSGGDPIPADEIYIDHVAGLLRRIRGSCFTAWRAGTTEITYTAGFALPEQENRSLPVKVERATVLIINAIIANRQRDPLTKSETVDGIGRTDYWLPGQASTLPHPEAEGLLKSFVMPRLF